MKFYLLDDDKHIRMILKQIITDRELGTVCGTGSNGHEGLEDVFELKPDIIIVDLLMPEMDGITFVEHARTRLPDTAFIMLSQVSSKDVYKRQTIHHIFGTFKHFFILVRFFHNADSLHPQFLQKILRRQKDSCPLTDQLMTPLA